MASPAPNGSYLQQADPQNFTGAANPPPYQPPAAGQSEQQTQPTQEVPKDEVGWYFVEQYYTTLNKTPDRLHLFYNKKSTMVWGTEGESLPLAHGRTDIQEKIAAHEFKDCKVRVSNVDSQASQNGGIVIQVLGEMSNNGLPNRKFSQTFFLAEQPNGYYVLNDIFRYLKDDDDIEEGDEYDYAEEAIVEAAAEAVAEVAAEVAEEIVEETQEMSVKEVSTVEIETGEGEKVKVEETVTVEPAAAAPPEPEEVAEETPAPADGSVESTTIGTEEEVAPASEEKAEEPIPPAEPEKPVEEPTPAPAVEEMPIPAPTKETPPPPAPAAPAPPEAPKTWARIAGGSKPAAPVARPAATAAAPAPVSTSAQPAAGAAAATSAAPTTPVTPTTPSGWQTADNKRHSRVNAAPAGQTQAYVKGITEAVTDKALKDALSQYGNLKEVQVNRTKNCAFVEFETPASFAAARKSSPLEIAGASIVIEDRRPRANPPYGSRGGISGRGTEGRPPSQGGRGYVTRDGQKFEGGRGGRGGRGGGGLGGRGGMKTAAAGN